MIFLQAAARRNGPAAALLELVEIGELELFVSEACLEEIREVLIRPSVQRKFPSLTISTVDDFLDRIHSCSVYLASVPSSFVLERDPMRPRVTTVAKSRKYLISDMAKAHLLTDDQMCVEVG